MLQLDLLTQQNGFEGRLQKGFSNFEFTFPEPQYLGAKHTHLDWIRKFIPTDTKSAIDAFAGSQASGKMMSYLRSDKNFESENIKIFKEELRVLDVEQPTIVAFGADTFKVLVRNFREQYDVWMMPHYSKYISKEKYREEIVSIIESKKLFARQGK